jgi:HAD superfamily hydrolase (TIGR01549 family)
MNLRCVIFDLDNTLVDSDLDFARIKEEIGATEPILEYRASASEAEKRRVDMILERHEDAAATTCGLRDGAADLMAFLKTRNVRTALLTRNSRRSVDIVLRRHSFRFDCIVSRDDSVPKPSPEPVLLICRTLEIPPGDTVVIGDFLYDIQAGQAAGCLTMLIDGPNRQRFTAEPDYEVASLKETKEIIEGLMKGRNVS